MLTDDRLIELTSRARREEHHSRALTVLPIYSLWNALLLISTSDVLLVAREELILFHGDSCVLLIPLQKHT